MSEIQQWKGRLKLYLKSGGVVMSADGPKNIEMPLEYQHMRASRYLRGAVKPWEWQDHQDLLALTLAAEDVEREIAEQAKRKAAGS